MKGVRGTIYLIHFERPLHHARHYLGWTTSVVDRLDRHSAGNGSRLMAAVNQAGIPYSIARIWPRSTRDQERAMKRWHKSRLWCPICMEGRFLR